MSISSWTANWRQWLFPAEFRIAEPVAPIDGANALLPSSQAGETNPAPTAASASAVEDPAVLSDLVATCTLAWKLRQHMAEPGFERPKFNLRRDAEALFESLTRAGFEIRDYTGHDFEPSLEVEVIARQPSPSARRARVQQTMSPSVFFRGELLRNAEVILETPGAKEGTAVEESEPHAVTETQLTSSSKAAWEEPPPPSGTPSNDSPPANSGSPSPAAAKRKVRKG